ncbi:MAG: hypothetical protein ABII68_01445 [Pseudomonadota bacterium]
MTTKSFFETHEKAKFYWQEGCRIAKEEKDYDTAIELIHKALSIVKKSRAFDADYKYSKKYQFYRQLTLLALKAEIPKDALKYAKLCNRPDFIADAYFENEHFEECLTYYMALTKPYTIYPGWTWKPSDKLSRVRIPKIAKAFYHLNEKYPKKYSFDNIRKDFRWLYDQVISNFGSLEDAFSYYKLYEKTSATQTRGSSLKKIIAKDRIGEAHEVLKLHRRFKERYYDKIKFIGGLLNQRAFNSAKTELINLFESYKAIEKDTGSKIIGNIINVADADLIIDIAEIYLFNNEFDEALSWMLKHLNKHWRYIDYYINMKFLLNQDITGMDIIQIGFSSQFSNNVGSVVLDRFYKPSMFSKRNIEEIVNRCEQHLSEYKSRIDKEYLCYLNDKYVNKEIPLGRYGPDGELYRYTRTFFGGGYGKYGLEQEISTQPLMQKTSINPEALHGSEQKWIHISFAHCPEMVKLISDFCTDCENELRRERGLPNIGEQWKSETEIYAFLKEILADYDVSRHSSPEWLSPMHLDVFVSELNFALEYQGCQHYEPVDIFGGQEGFEKTKVRDSIKRKLCKQNNVKLLYIRFDDEDPEKTIVDYLEKKLNVRVSV